MLLEPFDSTLNFVKHHDFPVADKIVTLRLAESRYPETARKALRMLIRLHETGFASFA
ncbi:MAG: hypothetical protein Fur0044_06910 [Anaerolineae bacterium]|nr:hypothetical protein [Anaerolineales bacterium]